MRHMVELSGESEQLARAEAMAVSRIFDEDSDIIDSDTRTVVLEAGAAPRELSERLGLAWSVSEHLFSCAGDRLTEMLHGLELPGRTFRVRTRRMGTQDPEKGMALTRKVGELISRDRAVDLDDPDVEVRILMAQRYHFGILAREIDRSSFEARKSENRPFSHPISLHPRLARALVNLTGIKSGQAILDPFCGTGGILLEAGLLGCDVLGGDIDRRMIDGSTQNLEHYGVNGELHVRDLSCWTGHPGRIDAIATDPPYGRSATTAKEAIRSLYKRAFEMCQEVLEPGGRLAIVLPEERYAGLTEMRRELLVPVRVHRSLTRYFCLFRN